MAAGLHHLGEVPRVHDGWRGYPRARMSSYRPALVVREHAAGVRLLLGSIAHGDGASLQEAADDLVRRALALSRAFHQSGFSVAPEVAPDVAALNLVYELEEIAASGGDVRARLFGA
jgi:hypothetical protein